MKLRFQSLLIIFALVAATFSCKDDDGDKKLSDAYEFNGKRKAIKFASFENNTDDDGGGYSFTFASVDIESSEEDVDYISIDIPKEMMGEKFELTDEQLYDWGWWIEFYNNKTEMYYSGFGDEGEMEDVKSGSMSAVQTGDNTFKISINIVFTDGKTLKLNFSGEMVDESESNGPARASSRTAAKGNSPNK